MRNLSSEFQAHLDGETTTLCNCWRIVRLDGHIMGFTDHDRDLGFEETIFEAASGFESSQMQEGLGFAADSQDVLGALNSQFITEEDIDARLYDGAKIQHFIVNWQQSDEHVLMRTLIMGEIVREDGVFKAEVKSMSSLLDQTATRRFQKLCNADLGDSKCGLNLSATLASSGTVESNVDGNVLKVSGIENLADGWFRFGRITFQSGANKDKSVEIAEHLSPLEGSTHSTLHLWTKLPGEIQSGDNFKIVPGCDKQYSTCRMKFDNGNNFRGFPHMPGNDFALSYSANSKQMDGGPLVTD